MQHKLDKQNINQLIMRQFSKTIGTHNLTFGKMCRFAS